jgi:hypothetical protein
MDGPCKVSDLDFRSADVRIALDESEHKSTIDCAWPRYSDSVRYWSGGILNARLPKDVFALLSEHVYTLIDELSNDRALRAA